MRRLLQVVRILTMPCQVELTSREFGDGWDKKDKDKGDKDKDDKDKEVAV